MTKDTSPIALLLTHSGDFYTPDIVASRLSALGYRPIRFNTDTYPTDWVITERMANQGHTVTWEGPDGSFESTEVAGLWLRKVYAPKVSPDLDESFANSVIHESKFVRDGALASLYSLPCIDPLPTVIQAGDKFWQLREAQRAGLTIPETLITSNPEEVKTFFHQQKGEVIAKMMTHLSQSMDASGPAVYTNRLEEEDLNDLDSLVYCPMTFQRAIPKDYELRVAYVGGKCFAGKINATQSTQGQTDWKKSTGETGWEPYTLPDTVSQQITTMMQALGLEFGALDLIKETNRGYVFLEVNPSGEWGMLQKDLDLPIGEAIADHLHSLIRQRQ